MSGSDDDEPEYVVGYGKPPKRFRFKPGQSGNPKGRAKGARGLRKDLHDELEAKHSIQINGKTEKGTRQRLMLRTLATRAATGDTKAAALLLPLINQAFGFEDRGGAKARLSPQDDALLQDYLRELTGNSDADD